MHSMRRGHDAAFKAKVALGAVKGEKTIAQLSSEFGIHGNQIRQCRKHIKYPRQYLLSRIAKIPTKYMKIISYFLVIVGKQ